MQGISYSIKKGYLYLEVGSDRFYIAELSGLSRACVYDAQNPVNSNNNGSVIRPEIVLGIDFPTGRETFRIPYTSYQEARRILGNIRS